MSDAPLADDEIESWYDGKSFSSDWTTWHFANWTTFLAPLRGAPLRVLEIGSWEGRSALFFLNYLRASHLVCVDTFGGNVEHMRNPHFAALVPETERQFDANVAAFGTRVEKIKGPSGAVLPQLGIQSRRFDLRLCRRQPSGRGRLQRRRAHMADGCRAAASSSSTIMNSTRSRKRASGRSSASMRSWQRSTDSIVSCTRLSGRDRQAVSCRASSACSAASGVNLDLPTKRAPLFKLCRGGTPTRRPADQAHAADRLQSSPRRHRSRCSRAR